MNTLQFYHNGLPPTTLRLNNSFPTPPAYMWKTKTDPPMLELHRAYAILVPPNPWHHLPERQFAVYPVELHDAVEGKYGDRVARYRCHPEKVLVSPPYHSTPFNVDQHITLETVRSHGTVHGLLDHEIVEIRDPYNPEYGRLILLAPIHLLSCPPATTPNPRYTGGDGYDVIQTPRSEPFGQFSMTVDKNLRWASKHGMQENEGDSEAQRMMKRLGQSYVDQGSINTLLAP
ncbi:hypothetical protein C8J57DRAFT_755783 [Mycena rebaudengoi]|nr:hypothetical protein C8J57DRAFT_502253 [Mycena rebaudengoi]KAJ7284207.1 hypothetical protein C8J57DRAFT_755783 [Mycena rebaudengoi]